MDTPIDSENTAPLSPIVSRSSGSSERGEVNYSERLRNLEERANDLDKRFTKLENGTEKQQTLTYGVVIGMVIVIALAAIAIAISFIAISDDYLNNNEERYEKFIDKTEEIKNNFYSKEEIDLQVELRDKLIHQEIYSIKNDQSQNYIRNGY